MTSSTQAVVGALPPAPKASRFALMGSVLAVVLTLITAITVEFSFAELIENVTRRNLVVEGLLAPDVSQIWSDRSLRAFIETLQLAILGTATGGVVALPLAMWATDFGNPNPVLRTIMRTFNAVIRSIP
ncbi:MAG: hypothetical protein WD400_01975, partial [Pontimonas sp.]